jgi:Glycosyltransferase WbsX
MTYLNQRPTLSPVLTIGYWNEWTEGHYLLPDTRHGYGMLRALERALK